MLVFCERFYIWPVAYLHNCYDIIPCIVSSTFSIASVLLGCMCARFFVKLKEYEGVCARVCMRACVCACACMCMHVCVCVCVYVHVCKD